MVDLMSRHGTYVAGKKIPPHDPFLLHGTLVHSALKHGWTALMTPFALLQREM